MRRKIGPVIGPVLEQIAVLRANTGVTIASSMRASA
jgi:hypothetical protein